MTKLIVAFRNFAKTPKKFNNIMSDFTMGKGGGVLSRGVK